MVERNYQICLLAPLGERNGTMYFHETGGKVDGYLNVLNEKNSFCGVLSKDGALTLTGGIRTLISTLQYTATGMISGRNILLNLKMDSDSRAQYQVSGEELIKDEEVL